MVASSVLLSAAAFAAAGLAGTPPWAGPKATPVADGIEGNERAHFLASMPEPTSPAELPVGVDLKKRQDLPAYLCGYVTGDIENSVYCSATRTCVFNTAYKAQACCIQNTALSGTQYTACSFYSSCKPWTSVTSQGAASFDNGVTSCNSNYPYCFTYSYTDIGFVNYGCSTRAYSSAVALTYSGQTISTSRSPITDTVNPNRVTGTTNAAATQSVPDSGTVQTVVAPAPSNSSKKSNTGAIAGGVVGGVAVLAIIIAAVVFFLLRSKKNKKNAAAAATGPGMQQQGYNNGMGPPPLHPGSPGTQGPMSTGGYYNSSQPGYAQPGMEGYQQQPVQPQYSGGMQPQGGAAAYYGQDQKSIPGFGDNTLTSPSQSYNPSMSPQNTGVSEAPANPAQHTGGSGTHTTGSQLPGNNAGPTPVYEMGGGGK